MEIVLVLPCDLKVEEVQNILRNLGCRKLDEDLTDFEYFSALQLPGDKGEAEFIREIKLGVNYLRLRMEGYDSDFIESIKSVLNVLSEKQVADLAQSKDSQCRRQSLRIIELSNLESLIPEVQELCQDSVPQVAYEAKQLVNRYLDNSGDPVELFDRAVHAHDRRQIIRWLIVDLQQKMSKDKLAIEKGSSVYQVLELAMVDLDWEVRVSAVIAAARSRVSHLIRAIEKCDLNIPANQLPKKREREIVAGIKVVAAMIVAGHVPDNFNQMNIKHQRWQKLYRSVKSPVKHYDDLISCMVYHFSTPNTMPETVGMDAYKGVIEQRETQYCLANTNIEMIWVSGGNFPVTEILDSEVVVKTIQNDGFFISRFPLLEEGKIIKLFNRQSTDDQIKLLNKTVESNTVSIPTIQQWRMAAQGTDARKYPWGWGVEEDWSVMSSEFGLGLFWTDTGEIVTQEEGMVLVDYFGSQISDYRPIEIEHSSVKFGLRIVVN